MLPRPLRQPDTDARSDANNLDAIRSTFDALPVLEGKSIFWAKRRGLRNTSEGLVMHPMLDHMSTSKSSGHGWGPLDRFEAVSAVRTVEARIIQVDEKQVLTIEALAEGGVLLPFQEAFRGHHAVQCGFCTPGMLITAHAFLLEQPAPTAELVRDVVSGNICRCKGYISIVEAILEASRHLREAS